MRNDDTTGGIIRRAKHRDRRMADDVTAEDFEAIRCRSHNRELGRIRRLSRRIRVVQILNAADVCREL